MYIHVYLHTQHLYMYVESTLAHHHRVCVCVLYTQRVWEENEAKEGEDEETTTKEEVMITSIATMEIFYMICVSTSSLHRES